MCNVRYPLTLYKILCGLPWVDFKGTQYMLTLHWCTTMYRVGIGTLALFCWTRIGGWHLAVPSKNMESLKPSRLVTFFPLSILQHPIVIEILEGLRLIHALLRWPACHQAQRPQRPKGVTSGAPQRSHNFMKNRRGAS
jgi:hypothetical protein